MTAEQKPNHRVRVVVTSKSGVPDPERDGINSSLKGLGFDAEVLKTGRIFDIEIDGDTSEGDALKIATSAADQLLAHPLTQSFRVASLGSFPKPREGKSRTR